MKKWKPIALLLLWPLVASASSGDWSTSRPDGHAPLGVMGDHTHSAGEWMLSYRYMTMHMDGLRDGQDGLSPQEVLNDFPVAMTEMNMEMHMLAAMYAPTDRLTFLAMFPYLFLSMDHETRSGVKFTTKSQGPGDVRFTTLFHMYTNGIHSLHLNGGLSLPTGSIDEKDDTPAGANSKLPYPMQLGSGTFDLVPGLTYLGQTANWSWGLQPTGTIRLGKNSADYALGDRIDVALWGARRWNDWVSNSLRINSSVWYNIDGSDANLDRTMVPTADPNRRAGERVDLLLGVNLYVPQGVLRGHRLAIEGGFPVYESLDGPQLETDWQLIVGWQASFG